MSQTKNEEDKPEIFPFGSHTLTHLPVWSKEPTPLRIAFVHLFLLKPVPTA